MKKPLFLILIILLSLFLRLVHLKADPPIIVPSLSDSSSLYCDDGMYPHNARNKVLFSQWITDDWNPFLYNPLLTGIYYLGFLLFGVSMTVVKVINVLIGCLMVLVFYLIANKNLDLIWTNLITLLFAFNLYFITYNKTGLLENFLLLCMMLTFYFFIKSENNIKYGLLVGAFSALVVISKFLFTSFIIIPTIAIIILGYQQKKVKLVIYYLTGGFITGLLWLLLIYLPNQQFFSKIGGTWTAQALPNSIKQAISNLMNTPFPRFMALMPFVFLLACVFMGKHLIGYFQRKIDPKGIFIFLWILIPFLQIGMFNYKPLRYFLPVILGGFIALIFLLKDLLDSDQVSIRIGYLIGGVILIIFFGEFFSLMVRNKGIFNTFPPILRIFIWLGLISLLILLVFKSLKIRKYILMGILIIALISSLFLYQRFFLHPTYHLEKAAARIHNLPEDSFIIGQGAPRLAFDSRFRAIPVYQGWFNDIDTFDRFPVTHIISVEKWNEHRFLKNKYPENFNQFKIINKLRYWTTSFILFEKKKETDQ